MIKKLKAPSRGATIAGGALAITLSFAAVATAESFGFGTTPGLVLIDGVALEPYAASQRHHHQRS